MLSGKGFFIWQISRVESGNVTTIADMAVSARLKHILIKIGDGVDASNVINGVDLVLPLVKALKARGLEVWGWHYLYGDQPVQEASLAIQRISQTGIMGYVIDAEAYYKEAGKDVAARTFMQVMRNALPTFPIALSTYRYPSFHPEFPFHEFLELCDYAMPQVYWEYAHNPREQLVRTLNEYRSLTSLPVVPTGAAYSVGSWVPSAAEVVDFSDAALDNGLGGVNFYEWYAARRITGIWEAISGFDWPIQQGFNFLFRRRVRADVPTLNVRTGPGTNYAKVGSLKAGTRVTVFVQQGEWFKISPDRELWVHSAYLDFLP